MAEKIVKGIDIVEKGALSEHIEQAKQLLVVYKQLDDEVKSTATSLAKMSKGFKATKTGDVGTAKATSDNMNKALIEQERLEQAQIRTKKALLQLEKAQQQQANKTAKAIKDEGNAYKQQSKTLTDLINRYQNLAARGRENGKVAKGLLTEINKLDAGLKKIDATVGRHQRNVGNYKSALNGLRGAASKVTNVLGQLGLAMGVGMVIRNTVNIVKDFEQANANLASILGVTTEQTKKLQDQQLLLGGSTSYTAAQVAELQTEYAKLGFTNQEILAATEGTLFLAKAAGVDLARAAEVAGSTLRGFGLDATETGRVTDVMALSFSKSALDMEKFAEAMKYVAPIAKVAGLTIEETTAMLGALANAGISGSNAGTALRQILSEMDKTGKSTSEALQDLATKGLNLADAEDEVGKNAKTALLVLTDQTKQTAELTTVLNGAAGSAKAMAEVQDNTLKGSIDRLSSAWEAWILNLNRSSGAGKSLRNVIEFLARNLVTILNVVVKVGKAFLIYKSAMTVATVVSKAQIFIEQIRTKGLKSMFVQQTAVNSATEKGTAAIKIMGRTINAVPIAMLITGLTILVTELLNMESASAAAARALDEVTESTKLLNEEILSAIENTKTQYQDNITQRIETLKNAGKTEKEIQEDITSNYIVELEKRKKALEEILAPDTGVSMMTMDILAQNFQQGQQIPLDNPMGVNPNQKTKYQAVVDKARNERIAAFKKELDEINLLLQSEKAREESSKKLIDNYKEVNVIEGKINSNREKSKEELSEMAKLEKQLQAIQLERSNLIIRQKGKESDRTLELKLQERELKKQIDRYKEIIEAANKLERVAPIGAVLNTGGTMTTQEQADKMLEDAQREFDYFNDQKKEKAEQLAQAQIQLAQDLTDITTFLTDKRIEAIDREIEAEKRKYEESKQNIDAIIAMREMDSNSMAQSIAFEKAEQAKALAAQEKLQRKKQRLELLNTSIGILNAQVAAGNGNPLGKTMADVTTLIGFIKSIPMFWEGTETTVGDSVGTKFSNGRDGILARVDKSEMILNKSKVDKLAAMGIHSTDDVVKRLMLGNGISNVPTSMVAMNDNSDVVNELAEHRALLKQLVNKPVTNTTLEQVGKVVKMIET
jgi:hypothetical protein